MIYSIAILIILYYHNRRHWRVRVDLGSVLAHQIRPSSVKGVWYGSSQSQNLPKIMVFGHRKPTQLTHTDDIWRISVDLGSAQHAKFDRCW